MNYIEDDFLQLHYGFKPAPKQVDAMTAIYSSEWKEVVINCGRSFGKDLLAGAALNHICVTKPGTVIMFITPNYSQADSFLEQVMEGTNDNEDSPHYGEYWIPQLFKITKSPARKRVNYFNGSKIICLSAENPKAIRSKRSNFIVVNEAAFIPESVINKELRAVKKKGARSKIIYISTPNGKNWFYKKFIQGLRDDAHENYSPRALQEKVISFHATYQDNPDSALDVDDMRMNLPQKVFEQEVMARFLDDSTVFAHLEKAFMDVEVDPFANKWLGEAPRAGNKETGEPAGKYIAAADFASEIDWTVFTVMDAITGKVVYWERLQKTDYTTQALMLLELAYLYNNAYVIFDATGVGVAVRQNLNQGRLNPKYNKIILHGESFNNQFKQDIIQSLAIRIERPNEYQRFIPPIPQLQHELRILEIKRTSSGLITYSAPDGEHDDCVISIALANYIFSQNLSNPSITVVSNFFKK